MPDLIGNITVPEIVASGVFPITPDYGYGYASQPEVAIHQFGSGNTKIEQRFLLGNGAKRFVVRKARVSDSERIALRDFWESKFGPYGAFTYNAPNDNGVGTTAYTCHFENEPLSWQMVADWACTIGVTLVEIPTSSQVYLLNSTVTRFPSAALQTALLSQRQELIPLIKITAVEAGYPLIYLSDRRCTVGGQLYQARLLKLESIGQSLSGGSDEARFLFGNADKVMKDLVSDTDLMLSDIELSLFHVGTGIKLDLWKGQIVDWSGAETDEEFSVSAADGVDLLLMYPRHRMSRSCWKPFDNALVCPFATQGVMDLVRFPTAVSTSCDKGYDTANGCLAHGMQTFHGGVLAKPQGARIKDNSTGTWGYGRSPITSTSQVSESIYDQVVPEIYTDSAMPVKCKLAAGRDESDFYNALAIVGEGPLGAYGSGHKLDGQLHHGYPGSLGLRTALGADPAPGDFFSLGQSGDQTAGDWRKVFSGNSTYENNFAAGLAFIEIKRNDTKGVQLTRLAEHTVEAVVSQGLTGYIWTDSGDHVNFTRSTALLTNPVWITVNMLLKARGLQFADSATQLQHFDVKALADSTTVGGVPLGAALISNLSVPALVGVGNETQFRFRGVLQEEKSLRDWMNEVLMNCLGYWTFAFGRLRIGIRINASTVEAFTAGNTVFRSLKLSPLKPAFNHLTAIFADSEFEYVGNSVSLYDIDHALQISRSSIPEYRKSNMNLSGTFTKSQASRNVIVRLREELGGVTVEERRHARRTSFLTTPLSLNVDPGMVCSMTHDDMPGPRGTCNTVGTAVTWVSGSKFTVSMVSKTIRIDGTDRVVSAFTDVNNITLSTSAGNLTGVTFRIITGEFRVTGWRLNGADYGIEVEGRTVTDSMYDTTTGPRPADVPADAVPVEFPPLPLYEVLHPNQVYPDVNDPMYDENDGTFGIVQNAVVQGDGMPQVSADITTKLPVTASITDSLPPQIKSLSTSNSGGSILGSKNYYIAVSAKNSAGESTPRSNVQAIAVTVATNLNRIILDSIIWPPGTYTGYVVFGSDDPRTMCKQVEVVGALPASVTLTAAFVRSTWNAPNPNISHVRVKGKRVIHAGRVGALVTAVDATSITCSDLVDPTDDWTGSVLSVIADASGGAPGLWNFLCSIYNPATGQCTVSPNPLAAGVEVGDVAIVRSRASSATSTTVTDTKLVNKAAPTGLTVNAEVGNILRIIAGTGRGQVRRIVSNTGTQVTVEQPWSTVPDTSSVLIWEAPAWEYMAESTPTKNALSTVETKIRLPLANLVDAAILVVPVLVDRNYAESSEELSPIREMWLFGTFGTIREKTREITADYVMVADDRVIVGNTATQNIVVTMIAQSAMKGEDRKFRKDTDDDNTMRVNLQPGDSIDDGATSFVLTKNNRSRIIKAGS